MVLLPVLPVLASKLQETTGAGSLIYGTGVSALKSSEDSFVVPDALVDDGKDLTIEALALNTRLLIRTGD